MTKRFKLLLIAVCCFVSSVAMADNKPEYSTIKVDGELIPVGDHHLYRYDYLPWNVSASPLFVIGHYAVSLERALTNYVAVRVAGSYTDLIGTDDAGAGSLSISVPIYFRKMQHGFFFEPSVGVQFKEKRERQGYLDDYDGYDGYDTGGTRAYVGSQIGWRMIWDSGFNVTSAVGVARRIESDSGDDAMALGRLDIGFAF